ncbi:hypothetical protein DFH28DRAFT_895069, partial [Melampsora americana]
TYLRHATRFNESFRPATLIPTPSFESINRMKIDDPFWEIEELTHPNEDWAVDPLTRAGIDAWRIQRSAREEMRRIGRELRQQLQWALVYSTKVKDLERNIPIMKQKSYRLLITFKGIDPVTLSLQLGMAKRACKLWITWKCGIEDVMLRTASYLQLPDGFDHDLVTKWQQLVTKCPDQWAQMIGMPNEVDDDENDNEEDEGLLDVDILEDLAENLQTATSTV